MGQDKRVVIGGWYGWPPQPIIVKTEESVHRLDLTGDRPLTKKDARKLAAWWGSHPLFNCILEKAGRYWRVFADKTIYK